MNKRLTTLVIGTFAASALLGACGDDEKSSGTDDYCARITKFKSDADSYNMDFGTATPDELEAGFTAMVESLKSLQDGAPASIAADVKLEVQATEQMIEIFAAYEWDGAALMSDADNQKLQELMTSDALATANDRLEQFYADECGGSTTTGG